MCLTRDALSPQVMRSQADLHAAPARSDHPGVGSMCATGVAAGLAPRPTRASGGDAGSGSPYGHGRLTGHGVGDGARLHARPSGLEPGHVVSAPGPSAAARVASGVAGARRGDDRPGGGRYRGTPQGPPDHGHRRRSRGGALDHAACHPRWRSDLGVDAAPGPGALGAAGMGAALAHRPLPACEDDGPAPAQHPWGWGPAHDHTRPALAAGATGGAGGRWRLCGGLAGAGLGHTPSRHGLARALGCCPVSSARAPAPGEARPQTLAGQAPTGPADLGGSRRYALGDRGGRLVRWPEDTAVDLRAHGLVAHAGSASGRHPRRPGRRSQGHMTSGVLLLHRPVGDPGVAPGVGRHALVSRGDVCGGPSPSGAGDPAPMVRPSHRPHHPCPVGPVRARHPPRLAAAPRREHLGAHDRLVSQGRADVLRRSGLGTMASLAGPLCGELSC
jgi:hypothetical protein